MASFNSYVKLPEGTDGPGFSIFSISQRNKLEKFWWWGVDGSTNCRILELRQVLSMEEVAKHNTKVGWCHSRWSNCTWNHQVIGGFLVDWFSVLFFLGDMLIVCFQAFLGWFWMMFPPFLILTDDLKDMNFSQHLCLEVIFPFKTRGSCKNSRESIGTKTQMIHGAGIFTHIETP